MEKAWRGSCLSFLGDFHCSPLNKASAGCESCSTWELGPCAKWGGKASIRLHWEYFLRFWKVTDLCNFVTGGMGRTSLQKEKALTNWPQTVSTGWCSVEEQLYRVFDLPQSYSGREGWQGDDQAETLQEGCFALPSHSGSISPKGSWAPLVLPHGDSYTQTTTGLHWPGLRGILGALDIIRIAAWMFAVVAALSDSFTGGSSGQLSLCRCSSSRIKH